MTCLASRRGLLCLFLALVIGSAKADACSPESPGTCPSTDQTTLLQSRVGVSEAVLEAAQNEGQGYDGNEEAEGVEDEGNADLLAKGDGEDPSNEWAPEDEEAEDSSLMAEDEEEAEDAELAEGVEYADAEFKEAEDAEGAEDEAESEEAECDEAMSGKGADYRGCQDHTRDGRTCQKWTSQSPHGHGNTPAAKPGTGLGSHNYCRNPDGEPSIWCYTTDPEKRWSYCDPKKAPTAGSLYTPTSVPRPTLPPTPAPGAPTPAPTPAPTKDPRPPQTPAGGVVVGQPYVCGLFANGASFNDRRCYCNGDVYYGKKFKSGSSGPELTFEEMITIDGGWKDWGASIYQKKGAKMKPMEDLKKESSHHPGWRMTFCGGCTWFKALFLYGGLHGAPKQCWCMPKYIATTPPPTTTQSFTWAPAPPGGEHVWG